MFVDFCEVLAILFIQISRVIEAEEKNNKNKQTKNSKQTTKKQPAFSPSVIFAFGWLYSGECYSVRLNRGWMQNSLSCYVFLGKWQKTLFFSSGISGVWERISVLFGLSYLFLVPGARKKKKM